MKQRKRKRDRICHQHKVRFKDCPARCGYRFFFIQSIDSAKRKRLARFKARMIAKRKAEKAFEIAKRKHEKSLCKCGKQRQKFKSVCFECHASKPKRKQKKIYRPKLRPCKMCGTAIGGVGRLYCQQCNLTRKQRQPHIINCQQCGVETLVSRKSSKFCSEECSDRSRRPVVPIIIKNCTQCGCPIPAERKKFCSEKCCDKYHHALELRRRNAARSPKIPQQIQKTCRICSQIFSTIYPNHILCSKKCQNKAARIQMRIRDKGKQKSPHVRVKDRLSSRLRELLHRKGQQKKNSISAYMGCTPKEMVAHVERQFTKGMSWENYGVFGWHLDHIIPCQRFDLTNEDHCRVCFNWRNIRPLWGEHNWNRQEMLTLDEALQIDPVLVEMAKEVGVRLW